MASGCFVLVFGSAGQTLVKFSFQLVVQLDPHDPAPTAFDLIAGLVIEAIEFRIMENFFEFLQPVVRGLILGSNFAPRKKLVAFLG